MKKQKILLYSLLLFALSSFGYVTYHNMSFNDIVFNVRNWIKVIRRDTVDLKELPKTHRPMMKHDNWSLLLNRHVSPSGNVDYKGFIQDIGPFQAYLDELSNHPPGDNWSEKEQLSYWINAYNAFTVKLIIDHYPLKSIRDIAKGLPLINSPFDIKFFKIENVDFDLNTIEHEILRKRYTEPRIHFAINCASVSCPKLRNEAFVAEKLNMQLEEQSKDFLNDPIKNLITSDETKLSKILDWFESDFLKVSSMEDFIKKYNPNFNASNKVEYFAYDWNLNE